MDLFKHHSEILLKCIALYLALVGTAAGFIFGANAGHAQRDFLFLFVCVCSALALGGWLLFHLHLRALSNALRQLTEAAQLPSLHVDGLVWAVLMVAVATAVLLVGTYNLM